MRAHALAAGAALAALLLAGCLPKEALSRRDDVEADLYKLDLDVDVVTEGLPVAPFRWHLDGTMATSYTRSFRDGSMGHMIRFEDMRGRVERDGQTVDVPVGFADALLELRAFPDGEVLMVKGTSRWAGDAGHLEVLDVLWPAISPKLPSTKAEAEKFPSSWPAWMHGGAKVRQRLEARWTREGDAWTYEGALSGAGGNVTTEGTASGVVRLGKGETRLLGHTFTWSRTTRTEWGQAGAVRQVFTIRGSLEHTGRKVSPPLDMPIASDDLAADAQPLRLQDGRVVQEVTTDLALTMPFVLLPDDLAGEERAALRQRLVGTW